MSNPDSQLLIGANIIQNEWLLTKLWSLKCNTKAAEIVACYYQVFVAHCQVSEFAKIA